MSELNPVKLSRIEEDIQTKYQEAKRFAEDARINGMAAVVAAIECGKLLSRAKKLVGHGRFLSWLSAFCDISEPTAWRWMTLANSSCMKDLRKCKTLTEAYRSVGIIPVEAVVSTENTQDVDIFEVAIKKVESPVVRLERTLAQIDVTDWPQASKQSLALKLKPAVDLYAKLQ